MKKLTTAILLFMTMSLSMAMEHQVSIKGFAFDPAVINVGLGDTITFTNLDGAPHNVIPRRQSMVQFEESLILNTNDSFVLEITELEDILAHCGVHPRMPGIEILID